ncbi:efflux transporter outer membrane subunit [Desulfoplanes formicivorans]|uniref:Multidrug transporter n=1 Tax=Desulfoplanes formicivorans TaxID=1592317 RepID=A0A194AFK1_9BACT|nr:efflux transporter outer membrane subunit [Desulfoplanes formicivorans]GAU08852.1 multidrug transporter [Desulfoplanes formicivorans]
MHSTLRMLVLMAGCVVVLGGCSLAPTYERPQAPVPAEWPQGADVASRQTDPSPLASDVPWETFFPDRNLGQVISLALENNRDLKLAALNVARAQALYGVQRAELYPGLGVSGAGTKERTAADFTLPGASRTSKAFNVDLGIAAWELDFFGRIRSLKDQALQEYLATEAAARSVRITLIAGVAKAYLNLAASRDHLVLARTALEVQEAAYALVKRRHEAGLATELDLRRAEVPVQTARGDIARYTMLEAQALNALNLLAGETVPKGLLPEGLENLVPPRGVTPGLPSETLLRRPDILAAEHRLRGGYAFIGAARAAFFPSISLTTTMGTASEELSGLFGSGSDTWNFTPSVAMPIFDPRTWAAYRVSKAQQKILLAEYEKAIQTAFKEVADALAVQEQIGRQIAAQEDLVQALARTYELSRKRYERGIDSYLGVLDAQRSLVDARQGLMTLKLTRLANEVQLYAVLGGGGE